MFCDIESPTLADLDDDMKMLLTAWWAVSDAEIPDRREAQPFLHYVSALEELARVRDKRIKPPIDTGVGTGLPSHRQIRARVA